MLRFQEPISILRIKRRKYIFCTFFILLINEHSYNIADLYFMLSAIHYFVFYFVSVNTILYFVSIGETVDCSKTYAIYSVVCINQLIHRSLPKP